MRPRPSQKLAVVLEREVVHNQWESHQWRLLAVIPDVGGAPRTLVETPDRLHLVFPGFEVFLHDDEAHGYFLNVTTDKPGVFVSIRMDEETGRAYPFQSTLSYNEAARWMDGSELVEHAPAWPELVDWMAAWVDANYKPEEPRNKRFGARSFKGKGRLREEES